jgi:hypothetical protein
MQAKGMPSGDAAFKEIALRELGSIVVKSVRV